MKKQTIKSIVIGTLVGVSVLSVSAYQAQIWNPVQFVKKLFVTPNGELDSTKATIVIDGTNWEIQAKSVKVNGKEVATKEDLKNIDTSNLVVNNLRTTEGKYLIKDGKIQWVSLTKTIVDYDGWRRWSDGTYARSCKEYRYPSWEYKYAWSIWDGVYWIKPSWSRKALRVYCNMSNLNKSSKYVTYFDGCYGWRYKPSKNEVPKRIYVYDTKQRRSSKSRRNWGYLCISYNGRAYCTYKTSVSKDGRYFIYDFTNVNKVRRCGSPAWDLCRWSSYRCWSQYNRKQTFEVIYLK